MNGLACRLNEVWRQGIPFRDCSHTHEVYFAVPDAFAAGGIQRRSYKRVESNFN